MVQPASVVKNIVLVHGAFADGTCWWKVIPLLEDKGYSVAAVQNPLTSLADDAAATRRTIALQDGPVILVGHSWGGAVITEVGDDPKVAALVYVSAYAPDVGQSANDASAPFGWTEGQKQIRVAGDNFATITWEGMREDIAQRLPMAERKLAFAVQGQSYAPAFDEKLTSAAWKNKPTWAIVSTNDRMLPPAMEESAAKRMGAVTTTLPTCHMVILEEPAQVAAVIDEAARTALANSVSYNKDIKPLFREIDVEHMKRYGVLLDDYAYMSDGAGDHSNATAVLSTLTKKTMPPGGPFWPQDLLDLFKKWMSDGYQV